MSFESLTSKLNDIFKKLKSKGRLSQTDIDTSMREVRLALLEADVNYLVVKDFVKKLSEKILGSEIMKSLTPSQMVIKMVNEELVLLLGAEAETLKLDKKNINTILMCGLQGSGKTTQSVKLALNLRKQGFKPLLVACDIYRPAAITQLQILANSVNIPLYSEGLENPVKIAKNSYSYAQYNNCNVIIIDTAGRLQIDDDLMLELENIKSKLQPAEILLVVDSMSGQDATSVAEEFNRRLFITGVILTKFDSDARGGAALSIRSVTNKPIKFLGTGEKLNDFEVFHPKRLASRILGMGDVLTLIENAQENIDKEHAYDLAEKIQKNKFNFSDFLNMLNQIKKLGPLKSILERLPGMNSFTNLNFDDKMIARVESMVLSMTIQERNNPEILNYSRKKRIAMGSGNKIDEVNSFLKRFDEVRKIMKQFSNQNSGLFSKFFKK